MIDQPRRSDIATLDALIRKTVPNLKPFIVYGMLGYGPYHYKYASGREGDASIIALASQKNYISLYVNASDDAGYLAEQAAALLPKANIGKSCIRFKKLADVDQEVLVDVIQRAALLVG